MRTLALIAALALASCQTVTIRPGGGPKLGSQPTWESKSAFFIDGLFPGVKVLDLGEICGKRQVEQIQARFGFTDVLLGGLTLGIYTPRTSRVWCAVESARAENESAVPMPDIAFMGGDQ